MPWVYLFFAGLLEVGWAVGLKHTQGFSRLWPSVWTVACMIGSFGLLALALKSLPLGTAYAIWTGIGAVGTVIYGVLFLNEPRDAGRLVCVVLIVAGVVGLKVFTKPGA